MQIDEPGQLSILLIICLNQVQNKIILSFKLFIAQQNFDCKMLMTIC